MTGPHGADRFSRRHTVTNARWFLAGKIVSAVATVAWLALVTRTLLPTGQLATYLTAIAYLETALALSLCGLDWLLIRHLPPAVAAGDGDGLRRLLLRALQARVALVLAVLVVASLLVAGWGQPAALQGLALPLLGALLVSEALLRLLRDTTLESLAAQRHTQLGVLGRTLLALSGVIALHGAGQPVGVNVLLAVELAASLLMLLAASRWVVAALPPRKADAVAEMHDGFGVAWRRCWPNYTAALISLPLAPQSLLLALSHWLAPAALVPLGLLLRVFEILRNYVPGLLLMNVLRPRLIGSHAKHGDFARTAAEAQQVSRWSAITVAPLLTWLGLYGDWALARFAGQALPAGLGLVLACMAASLLARVHRQIGQVLVNIVGAQSLLTRLALLGLLGWPLAAWLAGQGWPTWALALALGWDECAWILGMTWGLQRRGWAWRSEVPFLLGLLLLAVLSGALVAALPLHTDAVGVLIGSLLLPLPLLGVLAFVGLLDWRTAIGRLRGKD